MSTDRRGWRIALVPDALVNPGDRDRARMPDVLQALEANGYGLLQLPPPGEQGLLLAVIADQVAEYAHHGYAVVALGARSEAGDGLHWRRFSPLLRHRGVAPPARHIIDPRRDPAAESARLTEWLSALDLPMGEQPQGRR